MVAAEAHVSSTRGSLRKATRGLQQNTCCRKRAAGKEYRILAVALTDGGGGGNGDAVVRGAGAPTGGGSSGGDSCGGGRGAAGGSGTLEATVAELTPTLVVPTTPVAFIAAVTAVAFARGPPPEPTCAAVATFVRDVTEICTGQENQENQSHTVR